MDRIDEKLLGASVAREEIARSVAKSKVGEAVTGAGHGIREIREKVSAIATYRFFVRLFIHKKR